MKNQILIIFLFFIGIKIYAQDIITIKTGEEYQVIVKKVGVSTIEYIRYDNQGGPIYEVSKDDVSKIKYQNGAEDNFSSLEGLRGNQPSISKSGVFLDTRDSSKYKYVVIGNQTWMAENLKFRLGGSICNQDACGCYYTFDEGVIACPDGWHLPTDKEWMDLEIEVGMWESEASKEGWRGTSPGQAPALIRNGITGMELNMCGYFYQVNTSEKKPKYNLIDQDEDSYYWTRTNYYYGENGIYRHLKNRASIERTYTEKASRLTIRCVKD